MNRKTIEVIQQNPASRIDITEGHPMKGIACALRFTKNEMIVVINFFLQKVLTYYTNSVKIELSKLRGLNYDFRN